MELRYLLRRGKKYACRHDFLKNNQYAYKISRIDNWLPDYRWFKE